MNYTILYKNGDSLARCECLDYDIKDGWVYAVIQDRELVGEEYIKDAVTAAIRGELVISILPLNV